MPGRLFDSNVPLYLAIDDTTKADQAEALMAGGGVVSVQVLNEVANVALRKYGFKIPQVRRFVDRMRPIVTVVPATTETHDLALQVHERYHFAFYDSCIIAAALLADCDTLWSEDMHHGQVIDGRLTIRNPFA